MTFSDSLNNSFDIVQDILLTKAIMSVHKDS